MSSVDRRTFLTAALAGTAGGALLLAGCGGDDGSTGPAVSYLAITFPDGYRSAPTLVAGSPQRLTFVPRDEVDYMRETAPPTLALAVTFGDQVVAAATVDRHNDGLITPYYPLVATFAEPGEYEVSLPDYPDVPAVPFVVTTAEEVDIPQLGELLPVVDTPTVDNPQGVTPICTRAVPCPFHEHNLTDVINNGRPTVVLVATPGFCQTDICGPVVDLLIDAADGRDHIDFIHAEVYTDPSQFQSGAFPDVTAMVDALALPFEPALFVADADGVIIARLDTTFDRAELTDALASA